MSFSSCNQRILICPREFVNEKSPRKSRRPRPLPQYLHNPNICHGLLIPEKARAEVGSEKGVQTRPRSRIQTNVDLGALCRHYSCYHHSYLEDPPSCRSCVRPPGSAPSASLTTSISFDEVHFGKFASYYLQRKYFFDVHPPFGKLLLALVGYCVGYDGHYLFENIGEDYVKNRVPYILLRLFPAIVGSAVVPVCFLTLKEMGVSIAGCLFGAVLLIFGEFDSFLFASILNYVQTTRLLLNLASFSWIACCSCSASCPSTPGSSFTRLDSSNYLIFMVMIF